MAGDNVVLNKSAELSAKVVAFCKQVQNERREYEMTRQLIRSVTSIGANLSEANYAQSTADFISKLKIAEKEAGETGAVKTLFGRVRPIPELKSESFHERAFGERVAMNSPI